MNSVRFFLPALFLILTSLPAKAQEPIGGEQLSTVSYDDSLTSASDKTTDGYYYKGFPLTYEAGSRAYFYYSAYGPNYKHLSLVFLDEAGKITRYHSDLMLDTPSGTIELDTTFAAAGKINVLFTTEEPGEKISFNATAFYASPRALTFNSDADLCWKTAYLLKHSDNAFRFIISKKGGAFSPSSTSAPLRADAPTASVINGGIGSLSYTSTLGRGTQEEATAFFAQLEQTMKQCMGEQFEYKSGKDEKGMTTLTCTAMAETKGVNLRNLSYLSKKDEKLPKYVITLSIKEVSSGDAKVYDVEYKLENLFCQF